MSVWSQVSRSRGKTLRTNQQKGLGSPATGLGGALATLADKIDGADVQFPGGRTPSANHEWAIQDSHKVSRGSLSRFVNEGDPFPGVPFLLVGLLVLSPRGRALSHRSRWTALYRIPPPDCSRPERPLAMEMTRPG